MTEREDDVFHEIGYTTDAQMSEIRAQKLAKQALHIPGSRLTGQVTRRLASHDPDYAGDRDIGTEDMVDGILSPEQAAINHTHSETILIADVQRKVAKLRKEELDGHIDARTANARIQTLMIQHPEAFKPETILNQ